MEVMNVIDLAGVFGKNLSKFVVLNPISKGKHGGFRLRLDGVASPERLRFAIAVIATERKRELPQFLVGVAFGCGLHMPHFVFCVDDSPSHVSGLGSVTV